MPGKIWFLAGYFLVSLDGTGEFSSGSVCCPQCCKKEHKNGSVTYYHQMLGACVVHPNQSNVIPLCPEIIQNGDGAAKYAQQSCYRFIRPPHQSRQWMAWAKCVESSATIMTLPISLLLLEELLDGVLSGWLMPHVGQKGAYAALGLACGRAWPPADNHLRQRRMPQKVSIVKSMRMSSHQQSGTNNTKLSSSF